MPSKTTRPSHTVKSQSTNTSFGNAAMLFWHSYKKETPTSLKMIDCYLAYIMLTGIFQFVYMVLAGTFPYNAFLAGFISTVGSFVLAGKRDSWIWVIQGLHSCSDVVCDILANLRIQTNPKNAKSFESISPER